MSGFLCSMVGASFTVAAVAQVLRSKKAITAFGNAQVDTAQSKYGGASALFDGTGDYLFSPSNSDFGFGTGDFTLEGWFRFVNFTNGPALFDLRAAGGTEVKPLIYCGSDGVLYYYVNGAARITGSALSATTWYHITVSRASGSTKMFVNGTQVGSTYSDSNNYGTTVVSIGIASWNTAFNAFNGHADEIRISNSARYTTTFTPLTSAFVNDANTLLLIHANGTDAQTFFEDDNGVGRSPVGLWGISSAALSTTQSKFGGSSLLGSVTTLQQVQLDNTALTAITGPFTIEFYFRTTNLTMSNRVLFFSNRDQAGRRGIHIDNQNLRYTISGTDQFSTTGNLITSGTWHHIALVRNSSNTTNLYIDGTSRGSVANDTLGFSSIGESRIFGLAGFSTPDGNIDEFRISKTARYTSNFTAPTAPFVNDSDTTLLVHFDGTDGSTVFRDDNGARAPKGISALGNAQIDTAQSKFGGTSALFDGTGGATGDYLNVAHTSDLDLITSDITVEAWVRLSSTGFERHIVSKGGVSNVNYGQYNLYVNSSNQPVFLVKPSSVAIATSSVSLSANVWYHLAGVKSGTSVKIYVDGTERGSATATGNLTSNSGALTIGYEANTDSKWWAGHIDELRISNSARYTANFTAPTAPFQNDSNTVLLLHMDGTDASTVFTDDNGIAPYTP